MPGVIPPQREKMKTEMEALIYHFKIFHGGLFAAARRGLCRNRNRRGGSWAVLSPVMVRPKPLRVHFRGPSFVNLQACRTW